MGDIRLEGKFTVNVTAGFVTHFGHETHLQWNDINGYVKE